MAELPPCTLAPPPLNRRDYRRTWFRTQSRALRSAAYEFYKPKEGYARVSRAYWHDLRPEGIAIDTGDPDADAIILSAVRCGYNAGDVVRSLRGRLNHDPDRKGRDNARAEELIALFTEVAEKADAEVRRFMHPSHYAAEEDGCP